VTETGRAVDRVAGAVASMFGAGLFVGLAPAASLAGWWLVAGLMLAATLAVLFALSTSDDVRGGTPAALGILGRLAASVAIAGTFGAYVLPDRPAPAAVGLVVVVTAVVLLVPSLPAPVTRLAAVVVLGVLAVVAIACFAIAPAEVAVAPPSNAAGGNDGLGLLPAAALLYVCFVGPARQSGRDRLAAVGIVLVWCLAVAFGALRQLGGERLALSRAPLRDVLAAADAASVGGLLTVGVTVACAFALRGTLGDVRDLAPALRAARSPVVAVGLGAGLVALGSLLLNPVHALVGAAILLLGEAGFRVLAGRWRRA
jgi:APA family basic amino acid/polyamine antiporter